MKTIYNSGLVKITLAVILVGIGAISFSQTYDRNYQDGKIYFKFKDDVNVNIPVSPDRSVDMNKVPMLNTLRQEFNIKAMSRPFDLNNDPKLLRTFLLEFDKYDEVDNIINELMKDPDLEYAEKVPQYYIDYVPNDSLYNLGVGNSNWNWHLDVINAIQAWDVTTGDPDIKVAIVDNAVWLDHPDLENKIVLNTDVTSISGDSNPPEGGDPAGWSHGTHCSGLVGAETDNNLGVASIGYNISLIGVKATSDASPPDLITNGFGGLQWAANNGADIISMSWGSYGYSQSEQNFVNAAYDLGVVLVAAAGNNYNSQPQYPASYSHVISVAATNENDVKSDFSSYGSMVDVCAPGGYGTTGPQGLLSTTRHRFYSKARMP